MSLFGSTHDSLIGILDPTPFAGPTPAPQGLPDPRLLAARDGDQERDQDREGEEDGEGGSRSLDALGREARAMAPEDFDQLDAAGVYVCVSGGGGQVARAMAPEDFDQLDAAGVCLGVDVVTMRDLTF